MRFRGSHILSIDGFDRSGLSLVLSAAAQMEALARRERVSRVLNGAILANVFFEPSVRSRINFSTAFLRLGGAVREMTGTEASLVVDGESLRDTGHAISTFADVIVLRHPGEGAVLEFADAASVPVINAGDGSGAHPARALVDAYTIAKERGGGVDALSDLTITFIGDLRHSSAVHALLRLLASVDGVTYRLTSPPGLELPEDVRAVGKRGGRVVDVPDLREAMFGADVVYVGLLADEPFASAEEYLWYRGFYSISQAIFDSVSRRTLVMHRVANGRGLSADDNGIAVCAALFSLVLGVDELVLEQSDSVRWFR